MRTLALSLLFVCRFVDTASQASSSSDRNSATSPPTTQPNVYPPPGPVISPKPSEREPQDGDTLVCTSSGGSPLASMVVFDCTKPRIPDALDVMNITAGTVSSSLTLNLTDPDTDSILCSCQTIWDPDPEYLGADYYVYPESVSTEATTLSTEATTVPTDATTLPTEATILPTEATTLPTEATILPTEATTVPTDATTLPTEATTVPTDATTLPTEATILPTEATTVPTEVPTTTIKTTEAEKDEQTSFPVAAVVGCVAVAIFLVVLLAVFWYTKRRGIPWCTAGDDCKPPKASALDRDPWPPAPMASDNPRQGQRQTTSEQNTGATPVRQSANDGLFRPGNDGPKLSNSSAQAGGDQGSHRTIWDVIPLGSLSANGESRETRHEESEEYSTLDPARLQDGTANSSYQYAALQAQNPERDYERVQGGSDEDHYHGYTSVQQPEPASVTPSTSVQTSNTL